MGWYNTFIAIDNVGDLMLHRKQETIDQLQLIFHKALHLLNTTLNQSKMS